MADDIRSDIIINVDTSVGIAEIKNLQRQISQLNAQLLQSGARQARAAQDIQANLIKNINATGKFAANVRTISTTAESFTTALERNKLSMGEYFRYAGASTKTFGRLFKSEFDTIEKVARERVKTLQTQYIKLGRDANGAMKAIAVRPLALDMENLATKTALAAQKQQLFNQLLKQGSTNLLNFGKNTQWAGRQLMVGFTLPLGLMATRAGKEFEKIEKQAIRFKRVYGDAFDTEQATNEALDNMKRLADEFTKYGIEVNKTLELAADAAQMGLKGAELRAQVTEATRLAVLGEVEQQDALETTISVTNAFGVAAENLAAKINFLNAVENETVTAINDLTIAIPKAGPVVKQLGGDVEDLAFFLTAMKEGGINASEGANALKSGLASLINPSAKASEMLAGFGININGIVEANKGDIKGIVIGFAQALDTLDPLNRARAIEQLFGKFQFSRLSTLFQNVIKEGSQASKVLKLAQASTEELAIISERELKRVEESPLFKFQKQLEKFQAALAPLGEEFMKAITPILEFATDLLKKFNDMGDGAKQFAVIATTVLAGIGPIFLMTFGLIANGAANLIKLFANLMKMFTGVGKGSQGLGLSTEYMTQQQLEAAAVAASLDQSHAKLIQTFTSETLAVNNLASAYARAVVQQSRLLGINPETGAQVVSPAKRVRPRKLAKGILSVPGPKGAGDVVPAMLSPGEAIIPAKQSQKYAGLIQGMITDTIPGYKFGRNPFASMMGTISPKGSGWSLKEGLARLLTRERKHYGPSVTKYERKLSEKFLRSPAGQNVAVRMFADDFIASVKRGDTRYKNIFETGGQSRGSLDKPGGQREFAENKLFGIKPGADPKTRPAYGYLFNRDIDVKRASGTKDGILNRLLGIKKDPFSPYGMAQYRIGQSTKLMNPDTYRYGDIAMVLKKRALRGKTTITQGDSLNAFMNQYATPAKLGTRSRRKLRAAVPSRSRNDFFEAQILGGFSFRDIKRIVATEPQTILSLQETLRAAGLRDIRVGMPKMTMMQRLKKFVYGKDSYQDKLPRMQTSGKYKGKYWTDPLVIGGKKFYNEGTQSAQRGSSLYFDYKRGIESAHMSGTADPLPLSKADLERRFMQELQSGKRDGLFQKFGMNPDAIEQEFKKYLSSKGFKEKFKLYSNIVEPLIKDANQKYATPNAKNPASFFAKTLKDMPAGSFGTGILSRLPKDHGIPTDVLSTYSKDIHSGMQKRLAQLGDKLLTEDDVQNEYKKAEDRAVSKIKDANHRSYISDLNKVSRLFLTPGLLDPRGRSGASRKYFRSFLGDVQDKTLRKARAKFDQFLSKNSIDVPKDLKPKLKSYMDGLPEDKKIQFEKQLINASNLKTSSARHKAYELLLSGGTGIMPTAAKPKPKTTTKIPAQTFSLNRMLKAAGGMGRVAALGGIFSLLMGGQDILKAANGVFSVPGPKGAGDIVPAMLSPGESVIPAKQSRKYGPLVQAMISDSVPGYEDGLIGATGGSRDGGLKRLKTLGDSIGKSLGKTKELAKGVANGLAVGAKDAMAKAVIGKIGIPGALTTLPSGKILDNDTGRTYANQAEFDKEQARVRAAKVAGTSYQTPSGMIKTFDAAGRATVVSRENAKERAQRVDEARAAKAAEQDARRQKFAQGARGFGMIGMGVSMAAGAAAMLPGEAGKIAGDLAPLMLGLGTLAMFIQGPVSAALVALVAAIAIPAYAAFKAAEQFDNAQKKAMALAESLGTGDKAIQKFAEFAGNVTASELMDRRRSEKFGTFQIRSGKTTFGQAFMQSEAGQGMLGDVTGAIKSGGRGAAVSQLTAQMSTAVASGAMSAAQARSVVANLAEAMGDYSFGIQVNAELIRLLGPNGEDLTKDPLAVRLEILSNQQQQLKSTMDLAKKATEGFDWNAVGGAAAGAVAGGLAGAGIGAAIGSVIPIIGTGIGAAIGGAIGAISGGITGFITGGEEKRTSIANASGAAVAMQQMALEQQQQMNDSLELEYQKRIAAADAAGDLVEKERLLKELQNGRVKLLEQNQKLNQQIMDSYTDTKDTELRDALSKGADAAVTARYKEGPMAEVAKLGLDRLKESELTAEQQYLVKVQMASGELSPLQVVEMLSMETATQTKVLNIVTKYGGAFAGQVTALTGMFVDKDGKPIQSVVTNFVAKIDAAKTPEDAQKILDFYGKVSQSGAVLDTAVTVDFLLKNPEKANELQKKFDDIANIKGPLTVEVLTKVLGKDEIAAINEDLEYFNGLNDEEKKIYTQVLATTISTVSPNDPALQNWLKSEGAKWKDSPPGTQIREYAQWNAQVVTETSMDTTKAPSSDDGGGGGGTKQDPYEEPLRRLKEIREAAVNASGGLKEMNKWLGGNKNMKQFRGLEQQLIKRGASRSFIDYLLGLDKDIQAKFIKIKNGVLTLTAAGKTMGKVFNEIALGEFQVGLQESTRDATNQSIAFTKLTGAGMSTSQALAAVEDKAIAAAIASKSISAQELKNLANEALIAEKIVGKVTNRLQIAADILNEFGNLSMQDRFARNDTTFTEQEQLAIQMDSTLSKAYSDFISKGIPIPGNFGERLQQIMDSIQFKEKIFEDGFNKAMEKFAAQEEELRINMELELKGFKIDGVAGQGAREIFAAAQNEIAGLQFKLDDLNAGIQEIEWQEDGVNEKYDKRLEALDKIEKANQTIAAQQKTQLTLADALSQGDIAAAARAAQEMRSQSAQDALTSQRDILDASRQAELDNLRAANGKTRKELEASILDIEKQIFAIEEQRLEPAAEQIRKAEAKLAVDTNALTVAGKSKLEWEQIKNGIDIARTSSQLYTDAINAALDVVKGIKDYWDGLDNRTITTYHKIITIREDNTSGGSDSTSGGSGDGSGNGGGSDTDKDDQKSDEIVSDAEKSLKAFKDSGMTVSGYVKKIDSAAEAATKAAKAAKIKEDQAKSSKEFKDSKTNVSGYSKKLDLVPKNPGMSVPAEGFVKPNIKTGMDTINDAINWLGDVTGFKKTVDQILGIKLASGGMVKRYAAGGFAMGTDIIPAMLTPGEFVVRKYAVDNFGADNLKAINNGSYQGSSLYNYEVNVNVHSNADPNQIAGAVMTKIRQIDAQRIRGNRF